jgi:hypothetical protein
MIEIRPLTKDEATAVLSDELAKMTLAQLSRMQIAMMVSSLRGVYRGETLIGVWGWSVPTVLSDQAFIWLHVTPAFVGNEFVFIRQSQITIQELLTKYPRLTGLCEGNNRKAQRWLTWLGATFGDGDPKPFYIEASHG